MKNIILFLITIGFSFEAVAITLRQNDQIVLSQSGTEESDWKIKNRLIGTAQGKHFDIVLTDAGVGGLNNIDFVKYEMDTKLIASYLAAGKAITLNEPVTTLVLSNTAASLRVKLKTDAKFSALYAENLESSYAGAKSQLASCYNALPKTGATKVAPAPAPAPATAR